MSETIWSKLESYLALILAMAVFLLSFSLFQQNVHMVLGASDTAWLIKTGEIIVEHGLPRCDPFSYTCVGKPIVIYQWLFSSLAFFLYKFGGLWLVGLGTALTLALTYLWLMPTMMLRQGVKAVYVFGFLSLSMTSSWFWARPQVVSFLLITVFTFLLERFRRRGYEKRLWYLPLIMVLWANLHSFWFVGLLMVSAYLLPAYLKGGELERRRLGLLGVLCFFSVLLNPYGIGLVQYNLSFLTEPDFSTIGELQPYLLQSPYNHRAPLIYLALSWLVILLRSGSLPKLPLLLSFSFTLVCLKHFRFVPVAVLLTWPYLGLCLSQFKFARIEGDMTRVRSAFLCLLPLIAIGFASLSFCAKFERGRPVWFVHANNNYEVVTFIREHPELNARLFCDSAIGCSLILEGLGPVFIDSRFDFYGKKFCDEFTACIDARQGWQDYLSRWRIETIAIDNDRALFRELRKSDWLYLFDDGNCSIWLKNDQTGRAIYTRLQLQLRDMENPSSRTAETQPAASRSRRSLITSSSQTSAGTKVRKDD